MGVLGVLSSTQRGVCRLVRHAEEHSDSRAPQEILPRNLPHGRAHYRRRIACRDHSIACRARREEARSRKQTRASGAHHQHRAHAHRRARPENEHAPLAQVIRQPARRLHRIANGRAVGVALRPRQAATGQTELAGGSYRSKAPAQGGRRWCRWHQPRHKVVRCGTQAAAHSGWRHKAAPRW